MFDSGRYDNLHGDEPELEAEERDRREAYDEAHADDYHDSEHW